MSPQKVYFISDVHLGLPNREMSLVRERKLVNWLSSIQNQCKALYLMGDIFDYWYEYKYVVPRGFVRFFGKIAEFTDAGIPVYFFTGNHDIWAFDYFETELGMKIIRKEQTVKIDQHTFHLAHGDGLGPADRGFKILKWIFTNKVLQFLFSRVHPNFSLWLGNAWSRKSRYLEDAEKNKYCGKDNEWLVLYAREVLKKEDIDFFIFGHRHILLNLKENNSQIVILGDWIHNYSFAEYDGHQLSLKTINGKEIAIHS